MLTHENIVELTLLGTTLLTTVFFGLFYSQKRHSYLLSWTAAWTLLTLYYLGSGIEPWLPRRGVWPDAVGGWLRGIAAILFYCSAQLYAQTAPWVRRATVAVAVFAVWATVYSLGWFPVAPDAGVAVVLFLVGQVYWQEGREQESLADKLLAGAFVLWALALAAPMLSGRAVPFLDGDLRVLAVIPQLLVAVLMVTASYEEEKRRVEHNMLALSNLNLATSSFAGGEIQKMLAQTLDRVRGVVRIPSGALFMHHGDPEGPTSVVAVGLSEDFCAAVQQESLDDHLVKQVARLGGLGVFRNLADDADWAALEEKEEGFRKLRGLMVGQGLRTVVAISLQAKERLFGALLLGTPDNRRFTPPELRLLLALGHQIGMAVENSYLIQQTARRTEELHILNEIGRTLGSTLELDALFEKILTEMRRLFDVSNLYVAFYDAERDQIHFELEMVNGERKPKRSRPAGNHVTEYLIRTRQPILIREKFTDEIERLGLKPIDRPECYCGVPLVLYGRAFGVMAAYSSQPRSFDEGHLEVMRVLASEAGIAIENARLFSREQKKARQLTLLNNISRHAITTLNPDEMLAKIAQEMEQVLTYDYLGIGMLDYVSKEVVVQAEAGKRRTEASAKGRRIALGEGLMGQVARSGQMAAVSEIREWSPRVLLPKPVSAIALPIAYADQLLGVLYVETTEQTDFPDEERVFLRTLADLVAGALHNALTFQKAQEQAITDGLTGVKTHRFFMEALSAEWKRSTRAGRSFALVLMDLDRFKFVNDFYGHLEGDAVLQRIGQILEQNCRRSDVVARYGGDEFVVLMLETTIEQAQQLAAKLRLWVASDAVLRDKNITGSFGVAAFPQHGSTPQELIQTADASMYLSKHQGGNAVSTAEMTGPPDAEETQKWKRDVLEAYLGVALKRLFFTGPEAFEEIYRRLEQFTQSLATYEGVAANKDSVSEIPSVVIETVTSLAFAIDAKDHYTQGHSRKVAAYATLVGEAAGLWESEMEQLRLSGVLHDVGKVGVPEAILNKSGPLNAEEWEVMKTHPELGAKILEPLAKLAPSSLGAIQRIVKHHHEFYDGSGYPDGLAGADIPRGARIVAIADAYDTITSERTYKKGRTADEAFRELERCAGAQFDPELVRLFVTAMRQRQAAAATVPPGGTTPGTDTEEAESRPESLP